MAANETQVNIKEYATGNVTKDAYVELIASTSIPTVRLLIQDSSTQILKLAIGSAGNEVDICSTPLSGIVQVNYNIPKGTRISIKAISATASTGFNVVSLIPY